GALQSNKVKDAVALFDRIESVDRASLVEALAKRRSAGDAPPSLLMQVNIGEEPQKGGVPPTEAEAFAAWAGETHGVYFDGVMGVPPADVDPAAYFALLRDIRDRLGLADLSMGMSADFETAIAFGATHVRVGSALFGPRGSV
ncbi:MAG: alanine racemase, partial [Pseudomonadota bacterium]